MDLPNIDFDLIENKLEYENLFIGAFQKHARTNSFYARRSRHNASPQRVVISGEIDHKDYSLEIDSLWNIDCTVDDRPFGEFNIKGIVDFFLGFMEVI